MLARISLIWRLVLILLAALVAFQLVAVGLFYIGRSRATETGPRFPLPDQVAALVRILDRAGLEETKDALRVMNGAGLSARIEVEQPPEPSRARRFPGLEDRLSAYVGEGGKRYVRVAFAGSASEGAFERLSRALGRDLRIVVALADGRYLVVETGGALYARLLGLPPGFWAGIIGFLVAGLAVAAIAWQTRPLTRLARSVEQFGRALQPEVQREAGAPEMRALIRAVNAMQARIAGLVKSRSFVLGAISHDLRTYLTRLRLRVETVAEPALKARLASDVDEMQGLVEDALAFAEASFADPRKDSVDLARVVARQCDARRAAGAKVEAVFAESQLIVAGSATALGRAVGNLIDNALTYGGEARVTLASAKSEAEILVEDRGPGIPPAERERVFEPFHRLEESRSREQGGAGLGLAIAREIVTKHGGRLAVEDRPGGGARLRLSLPRPAAPASASAGRAPP